jgi:hypothetical protein
MGQAVPNGCFARSGLSHPVKKKNDSRHTHPQNAPAGQRRAGNYPPYAGRNPETQPAQTGQSKQAVSAPPPAAAPAAKRRGWFFNFSIGRFFTFRFLSENTPGVLARPEHREGKKGAA